MIRKMSDEIKLERAISFYQAGNFIRRNGGGVGLKSAEQNLITSSKSIGLSPQRIGALVDVVCSESIDSRSRRVVLQCLLPNSIVPCESVLKCLSWMSSTAEASWQTKALILRWIIAVFELISGTEDLHAVYALVFHFVNYDSLRKHACALLNLLTTKDDVRPYRVQRLMRLRATIGADPDLDSVLYLYKYYYPHLVTVSLSNCVKIASERPYSIWSDFIKDIKVKTAKIPRLDSINRPIRFWNTQKNKINLTEESEYFPDLHSQRDNLSADEQDLVPLYTVSSIQELFEVVEKIKLPVRALTVLRYPVLHHVVAAMKDADFLARFKFNLHMILYNDFVFEDERNDDVELLLVCLNQFCDYLQEGIPVVEGVLLHYLSYVWNGHKFIDHILHFVTRLRLRSVDEFKSFLDPIKRLYYMSDLKVKVAVLYSLTELLQNTVIVEIPRYQQSQLDSSSISSRESKNSAKSLYVFEEDTESFDPLVTVQFLIDFVDELCITGLLIENGNLMLLHYGLSFYRVVAEIVQYNIPFLKIPPPIVVYGAMFSVDAMAISRVCSLLCRCFKTFLHLKKIKDSSPHRQQIAYSLAQIQEFNDYVLSISNMLWRKISFQKSSLHQSVFDMPQSIFEKLQLENKSHILSILRHPAMIMLTMTYDKTIKPITKDDGILAPEFSIRSGRIK